MTDYLEGAHRCRDNTLTLQFSAQSLIDAKFYSQAAILLDTAMEEISKGLYCAMVHRGWLSSDELTKILKVFSSHDPKFLLSHWLPDHFSIVSGQVMIDGVSISNMTKQTWRSVIESERVALDAYMDRRNSNLYVGLDDGQWVSPKELRPDPAELKKRQERCLLLIGLIFTLANDRPITSLGNIFFGVQETGAESMDIQIGYDEN